MTNNRNYYTSSNYASTIPTRKEFNRYASNLLSDSDFNTECPIGNRKQAQKICDSIKWTVKHCSK